MLRTRLSRKMYGVLAISLVAVAMLVAAALHFALIMRDTADGVASMDRISVSAAFELEALLEQHRRDIETRPKAAKGGGDADRREVEGLEAAIQERAKQIFSDPASEPRRMISQLVQVAQSIRDPDIPASGASRPDLERSYDKLAGAIDVYIRQHRQQQALQLSGILRRLSETSQGLLVSTVLTGLLAALLIGPLGLLIVRRIVHRLEAMAQAMVRLAQNDTAVGIPGLNDPDEIGAMARAMMVFKTNAIELLDSKLKLEQLNRRLDAAIDNMPLGLSMFDADDRLVLCNDRYRTMYGFSVQQTMPGAARLSMLECLIASGHVKSDQASKIERMGPRVGDEGVNNLQFNDGRIIEVTRRPTRGGGWVSVHEDVTARCLQEARITHMAAHDALTGLGNRRLFRERLEGALATCDTRAEVAVHCLDLDGFKSVNDTLGHSAGDRLLKLVSERLQDCVRSADIVARIGGDEFAIIQTRLGDLRDAEMLAQRIIEQIAKPYLIMGHEISVGVSVGIAVTPDHGREGEQILRNADMALYCAKGCGRGTYVVFEPEMDSRVQERRSLELELRSALGKGEFELHYQPIVMLDTGNILGFEALIRWRNPNRGLVPPSEFISIAEEVGLIVAIGEWALETACREAARWPAPYHVAVNLSPLQFRSPRLVETVEMCLRESDLDPRRLELEITESTLLQDSPTTLATLHNLRRLGLCISMDDFGTGYSSLSYLRSFPFDKIKIDKAFIRDIAEDSEASAIVEAVMSLARSLSMETLAEGVETAEQLAAIKRAGCQQAQGYFFSPPVPSSQVADLAARLSLPRAKVA